MMARWSSARRAAKTTKKCQKIMKISHKPKMHSQRVLPSNNASTWAMINQWNHLLLQGLRLVFAHTPGPFLFALHYSQNAIF